MRKFKDKFLGMHNHSKEDIKMTSMLFMCILTVMVSAVSIISIFYAEHINSYVDILWVSESDAIVILLLAVISLTAYGMIFYYSKRKEITLRVATLFMTVVFICESIL